MNHENSESQPPNLNVRKININEPQTDNFLTNYVSTTKYSCISFIPKFIWEQLHNYTNCFFLLISIFQQFPDAATLGRFTTVIPLSIMLSISAVKEILEDLQRRQADKKMNQKVVQLQDGFSWRETQWRYLLVGDVVAVHKDELFPADILLLQSSDGDICYIETVNLDGENNLKIRRVVPGLSPNMDVSELLGTIECDLPNEQIYNFTGVLRMNQANICLTANHLLLRGAILRNTEWIRGLVIYAGHETKIMQNTSDTRMKRSSIAKLVNFQILILFAIFVVYTLLHWVLFAVWNNTHYSRYWYIPIEGQNLFSGKMAINFLVFGIIYSIIIPISLQVMQDLSRIIQGLFINHDTDMYYEPTKSNAQVNTSSLNEDLALVKYIFSDKTGTLTQNLLEFKSCTVSGIMYSFEDIQNAKQLEEEAKERLLNLFLAVCLCPGVVPVESGGMLSYFTSSPDQKALLLAAQVFGCTLVQRTHNLAVLEIQGTTQQYEILCEFEFRSDQRRTSVIVRNPTKKLILYAMGADDVIMQRQSTNTQYTDITCKHIQEFSTKGLRSICVAMVELEEQDFQAWLPLYLKAKEAIANQEVQIDVVEALIVKNLNLLGATAVEDKLQDEVPETISSLLEAGIHIWMLTGDKCETAINIAVAARFLSTEMELIKLVDENMEKVIHTVEHYKNIMGNKFGKPGSQFGLIMNGACLPAILDSELDPRDLISLMLSCQSVICYRTTPKQKSLIVEYIKKYTKSITMAVGDGANDVAMIQTAGIGIGISGTEGLQAANAADYSIAQFRYLKKLLLVHGTWNYNRLCKLVYFIYYKNMVIATMQFYYAANSGWSGLLLFDTYARMMFNVFLTGAPTLALGIFEQNLSSEKLMRHPYLYTRNRWFNNKSFTLCLVNAFLHAILLSWLSDRILDSNVFWENGRNDSLMFVGNVVYTALIFIVCWKSVLHSLRWTNITIIFLVSSQIFWIVFLALLSYSWPFLPFGEDMTGMIVIIVQTPIFWFYIIFIIVCILGIDFVGTVLFRIFREPLSNIGIENTTRHRQNS